MSRHCASMQAASLRLTTLGRGGEEREGTTFFSCLKHDEIMIQTAIPRAAGRGYVSPAAGYSKRCYRPILYTPASKYNEFLTSNMLIASAFQQKNSLNSAKQTLTPMVRDFKDIFSSISWHLRHPRECSSYLQRQTC